MKTRPKDQGTAFESAIVMAAKGYGLEAERLAEGGSNDRGDVVIGGLAPVGLELLYEDFIIEAKARANLNIHAALVKAQRKAEGVSTVVFWKRLTRKAGNTRRTADGPPVVVMSMDLFFRLIGGE